ncbi:topoisomerase II [Mangrovactinospora gilvigrisea]|uniref:Topoisomerase II n=1 Tax=Mangrovactinospora gilvigrisea TaxID=1428644 RepID=A0A1J7CAB7_9ACTN|nr:DUF5926 family protein [Mangrovactinospora gilvigrisea]OIV38456.1 topoisomerase II [Mangrovactinospora gilvigrisea]
MGKRKAQAARGSAGREQLENGEVPVVGAREPCPCGSGRRYKACHGRAASHAAQELVRRPFEGLAGEADWIALRELVPAATAELTVRPEYLEHAVGDGPVRVVLATVLPMAWPALRRADGTVLVGLQTNAATGDASRDAAQALLAALATEPGSPVAAGRAEPGAPRLQDVLDPSAVLEPAVHEGFDFWLDQALADGAEPAAEVRESLDRANATVIPTVRLGGGLEAAYWCAAGERNHLRWVLPHDEERLLDAVARLYAAGEAGLGEGTRFVGSFRAHGLAVPVWDLPTDMAAEAVEGPAAEWLGRFEKALAADAPLTAEERRARSGLTNRQITLS